MTVRTRRTAAALAAVVMTLGLAACGGGGGVDESQYREPTGPSTETITIESSNFRFDPEEITASPGIATIKLTAKNGIHDFVFEDAYPGFRLEADGGGGTESKKIALKPGKYTFYCTVTGHRAQGMEGTLTVR
jgi:plastocyanin